MRKIIFITCFILCFLGADAQWVWSKRAGGTGIDYGSSIATDPAGNVLVTGYFYSPAITFGSTTLTNSGGADLFVVKYDAGGNVLWADKAGGASQDMGSCIRTDLNGNVFVTGNFQSSSIVFGSTTLTNADNSGNTSDLFIVKYDPNGTVLWAKRAGGTGTDMGTGVGCDTNGNVFVTGYFTDNYIVFGNDTAFNSSNWNEDIFLVKYDLNGNETWVRSAGGQANDYSTGVAADPNGNAIITGFFNSNPVNFGNFSLNNSNFLFYDLFIAKYSGSGTALWAKRAGGSSDDYAQSIATDAGGNVFIAGYTGSDTVSFGSNNLTNTGGTDMFIAKYDPSGNAAWAKNGNGTGNDYGYGVCTDAGGNALLTGKFQSVSLTLGSTTLFNSDNSGSTSDMYAAKYDPSGNVLWSQCATGAMREAALGICTDAGGNAFVTGWFDSQYVVFGSDTMNKAGGDDIFVAKLGPATGTPEESHSEHMLIFPNPSNGIFTVQSNESGVRRIDIYNVLAEKIYSTELLTPNSALNLSDKPKGIYFYKIIGTDNIAVTGKLVIE